MSEDPGFGPGPSVTLDGADHASHAEQAPMIRRYTRWRNRNAHDPDLTGLTNRANVA